MFAALRIFFAGIVFLVAFSYAVQGECPDIAQLRELYQQRQYIQLDFLQLTHSEIFETVDSLGGTLWAGKGGRFRLKMPDQVLVSDGILYWSYSVENEQVLVDTVAKLGEWNPLTLLYDPEKVYTCRRQEGNENYIEFEMSANDTLALPQQFIMRVAREKYTPQEVTYFDDNDSRIEVFITGFSQPARLPDSLFNFRPGPGVEIIEMP